MVKSIDLKDSEYHYSFGYYSQNKWLDDRRVVLIRSLSPDISVIDGRFTTELVIFDTDSGEIHPIASGVNTWCDYVVSENNVFYIEKDCIVKLDILTGEKTEVFKEAGIGSPHLTADGKYLSVFRCRPEISSFWRVEVDTGEAVKLFDKAFPAPFPYANHGMISPADPSVLFFSHEGDTRYITNRLWIYDTENGAYNIARQRLGENGELIDCYGHECWANDGKGVYFVKYRESESSPGIYYADVKSGKQSFLFGKYDYWHVSASCSERYITADTRNLGGERSGVVLIDLKNGTETLIDTVKTTFKHPCHPHPQLSPGEKKIVYHAVSEEGKCYVRITDLNG